MKFVLLLVVGFTLTGCDGPDFAVWGHNKRCKAQGGQLIYREALTPAYLCIKVQVLEVP